MEYMGISVRMTTRDCYHSSRFVCSDEFSLLILTRHFKVLVLDHLNPALRNQSQAFRTQLLAIIFILFLLLPLLSGSHQRQIFNLGFGFFLSLSAYAPFLYFLGTTGHLGTFLFKFCPFPHVVFA